MFANAQMENSDLHRLGLIARLGACLEFSKYDRGQRNGLAIDEVRVNVGFDPGADRANTRRDASALKSLYEATAPILNGLVLRIVKNRSDAHEILCDVYRHVWTRADRYDATRASVVGWLSVIARSRALDFLRAEAKRSECLVTFLDTEIDRFTTQAAGASRHPDVFVEDPAIRSALAKLPAASREVLSLAYLSGLTHMEIAQQKSLPLGTVKSLIRRSLNALKHDLTMCG